MSRYVRLFFSKLTNMSKISPLLGFGFTSNVAFSSVRMVVLKKALPMVAAKG